jgi:hypothetical protein
MRTSKQKPTEQYQSAPTIQTPKLPPTPEQIRQRAYEIHKARGGQGHPLIDWLQAEHELKVEMSRLQEDNPAVQGTSLPPQS